MVLFILSTGASVCYMRAEEARWVSLVGEKTEERLKFKSGGEDANHGQKRTSQCYLAGFLT